MQVDIIQTELIMLSWKQITASTASCHCLFQIVPQTVLQWTNILGSGRYSVTSSHTLQQASQPLQTYDVGPNGLTFTNFACNKWSVKLHAKFEICYVTLSLILAYCRWLFSIQRHPVRYFAVQNLTPFLNHYKISIFSHTKIIFGEFSM